MRITFTSRRHHARLDLGRWVAVMSGQPGRRCPHCHCDLEADIRFYRACGNPVGGHVYTRQSMKTRAASTTKPNPIPLPDPVRWVPARPGVRCASYLLDLAAMMSPAMPLSVAGVALSVAEVVYVVVPVAFLVVWLWMQIWQGLTGLTFGKSMLGLRLIRTADLGTPGIGATLLRSLTLVGTLGLAYLPVVLSADPKPGLHDRISGLTVLDVEIGQNPLGRRQQVTLRRSAAKGLNRVSSPVPVHAQRQR